MRQAYGLALGTAEDLEARTRHVRFPQSVLPSGSLCFRFARLVPGTCSLIRIPRWWRVCIVQPAGAPARGAAVALHGDHELAGQAHRLVTRYAPSANLVGH